MANVKYRTIVADPPWDHSDGTGLSMAQGGRLNLGQDWSGLTISTKVPYLTMGLDEIAALPVADLAEDDAHLYLWTTNRYLRSAYDIAETWGFRVVKPLIWCKSPKGFMGGAYTSSCEFALFARRGSLATTSRAGRQWWNWPRSGRHSAKPEPFLDIVESVSPGPYLELFARRQRIGWDSWGNECRNDVELEAKVGELQTIVDNEQAAHIDCAEAGEAQRQRAEKAEAELAALKARRCDVEMSA